ncbi:MAG: polyketide synthase [Kiritimatiellae bacterium]|nr:polyketide synthase [Kiritimatiellia bacterium]
MDEAVAIVGMSCRFAGCATPAALWNTILSGKSRLSIPGPDAEIPFGAKNIFDRPYPSRIGLLGNLYSCVPSMQNFPRQVNAGENQDLYFATQMVFDALTDASMRIRSREPARGTIRIGYAPPFNASTVNWLQHTAFLDQTMEITRRFMPNAPEEAMEAVRARLKESLPEPNPASFLMGTGYRFASWIARECAFSGEATVLDAGMLSGAAALRGAARDLRDGSADIAIAGAISPPLGRFYLEGLSGEILFSSKTSFTPFSDSPDGTVPGEGGAIFVLKRREDALRAHDRIYALLRSVEISHNPEGDGSAVLAAAMKRAGAEPAAIGLIEADGSGMATMEAREIEAVSKLWGEHAPGRALVGIGSVKGNIGHTLRAAAAAGVAKATLALHHRVLPPQTTPARPATALADRKSSAYLLTAPRPWIAGRNPKTRMAAVLAANFDPVNPVGETSRAGRSAAIILEEEPETKK